MRRRLLVQALTSSRFTCSSTGMWAAGRRLFGSAAAAPAPAAAPPAPAAPASPAPPPPVRRAPARPSGIELPRLAELMLAPDSDVGLALRAAAAAGGRAAPEAELAALAERLETNWFKTAADVAAMSAEEAAALGVPLRLRGLVAEMLEQGEAAAADSDGDGAPALDDAAAPLPALALDGALAAGDDAWVALPIEERRCPPLSRAAAARGAPAPGKVTTRVRQPPYALSEAEVAAAPGLAAEFADFTRFHTTKWWGQQAATPILPVTAAKYRDHLRGLLGWLHRTRGVPLAELSLRAAAPSADAAGAAVAFDYCQWLRAERGVGVRTEGLVLRSVAAAAKWAHHAASGVRPGSGAVPYSDLEVVKELRILSNAARRATRVAGHAADERLKWLDWPDYLKLVAELRRECAALDAQGRRRPPAAVAWSLQRYLIFAILACVPDRQRTLRELEVGRTLFREQGPAGEARWVIRHAAGDYKTGQHYGPRPPLALADSLRPELEAFISEWRKALAPRHGRLFSRLNGEPLTEQAVHRLFTSTAARLAGRRLNPHMVRDSCVTHLRGRGGVSERELEAVALLMGHSLDMQRGVYDRRTKEQRLAPAVELLHAINDEAMGGR